MADEGGDSESARAGAESASTKIDVTPNLCITQALGNERQCIRSGYLRKGSAKDPNVWRRRWFVLKHGKLWYCKAHDRQVNISCIDLVECDKIAEAPREVCAPYCFEIHDNRRVYQLCAANRQEMTNWIKALLEQLEFALENQLLGAAEMLICDEELATATRDGDAMSKAEKGLEGLLEHPAGYRLMLEYTTTEERGDDLGFNAKGNLDFLLDAQDYKQRCEKSRGSSTGGREVWDMAAAIIEHYLHGTGTGAAPLSVDAVERSMVWAKVQQHQSDPPPDLFLKLQQEVLRQLEEGPYQRLLHSPSYSRSLLMLSAPSLEPKGGSTDAGTQLSTDIHANGNHHGAPKRNSALRSGRSFARVGGGSVGAGQ
jgi:hypothetical protein